MTGLDLLLICSGAIVLMTVGDAILRIVLGPDPDLQGPPWHPDPQWAIRQPAFPARERERPAVFYGAVGKPVRRAGVYRDVAPETESERAYGR